MSESQKLFAKNCAQYIIATRAVPGIRAKIEEKMDQFPAKERQLLIRLVHEAIQTIKREKNIEGTTVVGYNTPSLKTPISKPKATTVSKSPKATKQTKATKKHQATIFAPEPLAESDGGSNTDDTDDTDDLANNVNATVKVDATDYLSWTETQPVLEGQDLGCTAEEINHYEASIGNYASLRKQAIKHRRQNTIT